MIAAPETCDLVSLASGLRSGNFPALDYLRRLEAIFDAREPEIQAFLPEQSRFARLRREAAELLERYPDPKHRPPLFAVPIAIDDALHASGFATRAGSRLDPELLSGHEASCVSALRRAGALIIGKTATAEFGYLAHGPTRNPHDSTQRLEIASSGAAAAVAAGLTPLALGTQTLGAANQAAARCGVVGFKPSYRLIGTDGLIPLAPSLDQLGLLAGNIASLEAGFRLLTPIGTTAPGLRGLNIGIPDGTALDAIDAAIAEHFQTVCASLHAEGCSVQTIPLPDVTENLMSLSLLLVAAEAAHIHASWYRDHRDCYQMQSAALIEQGKRVPARAAERARTMRLALRQHLEAAMDRHRLDFWLSPCVATFRTSATAEGTALQLPWVVSGLPSLALPAGFLRDLPIGVQLTGRWYGDERLLQCAKLIEPIVG